MEGPLPPPPQLHITTRTATVAVLNIQRRPKTLASLPFPYHPIHGGNTAAVTWKLMDRCNRSDYKHFAIVSSI